MFFGYWRYNYRLHKEIIFADEIELLIPQYTGRAPKNGKLYFHISELNHINDAANYAIY